jgi:hypothetical protein
MIDTAASAIGHLNGVLRRNVRSFNGFEEDEIRAYAQELALRLQQGQCDCRLPCCKRQHRLPDPHPPPGSEELKGAVRRAVIGDFQGDDIQTGSLSQSMLYRYILTQDHQMLIADVEVRKCGACGGQGRVYEGDRCPGCGLVFDPVTTQVCAQMRLFIQGVYVPLPRWACGPQGSGGHFYAQQACRSMEDPNNPQGTPRVRHGPDGQHDCCPWQGCQESLDDRRHRQRPTTLWVHRIPARTCNAASAASDGLARWNALETGTRQWLQFSLSDQRREEVEAVVRTQSEAAVVEAADVLNWLLEHHEKLPPREAAEWRDRVGQALAERNLEHL